MTKTRQSRAKSTAVILLTCRCSLTRQHKLMGLCITDQNNS